MQPMDAGFIDAIERRFRMLQMVHALDLFDNQDGKEIVYKADVLTAI